MRKRRAISISCHLTFVFDSWACTAERRPQLADGSARPYWSRSGLRRELLQYAQHGR
jgi:hypothetical protein